MKRASGSRRFGGNGHVETQGLQLLHEVIAGGWPSARDGLRGQIIVRFVVREHRGSTG